MANGVHQVVVYVRTKPSGSKLFTVTARKPSARLPGVERQTADAGYTVEYREVVLNKQQAEARKAALMADYIHRGYEYQRRRLLPLPM